MSEEISSFEHKTIMTEFMNMLRIPGYDQKYRHTPLTGILARHKECERAIAEGTRVGFVTNLKLALAGRVKRQ